MRAFNKKQFAKVVVVVVVFVIIVGAAYYNHLADLSLPEKARKGVFQKSLIGAKSIAVKTGNSTANNIVKFLEEKVVLCDELLFDSIISIKEKKDSLYVIILMNFHGFKSKENPELASKLLDTNDRLLSSNNKFFYHENVLLLDGRGGYKLLTEPYWGMVLLYGCYLHGNYMSGVRQDPNVIQVAAMEFAGDLFQEFSPEYKSIFNTYLQKNLTTYSQTGKMLTPDDYLLKLVARSILDPSATSIDIGKAEFDFFSSIFFTNSAFDVFENVNEVNSLLMKASFIENLEYYI